MNGQPRAKTQDRIGMIDVIAQDTKTGEVVLRMDELDPWDGSDERLLALQERFNAYVSFLLDGEMASARHDSRSARVSGNKTGSHRKRSTVVAAVLNVRGTDVRDWLVSAVYGQLL